MKQQEYLEFGSIKELDSILQNHNPKKIFLVTGRNSYEICGAKKTIEPMLDSYKHVRFYDFSTNPKLKDIEKGISLFRENQCDFVIAVGGGSVIDVAKSVNVLGSNKANPLDYVTKKEKITNKGKPFVAIPTTAGSGSEATHFAVIYIDKTKYSLAHEFILPDYCIVDPVFTDNLPPDITASTGIDALGQAIESYWCINSTEESKECAAKAIPLIMDNLKKAVNSVNNPSEKSREARDAMALAAHLAGKAINISKTTASHAISYPITSFFNIPHGHAVGLTLPSMIEYNADVSEKDLLDKRGVKYVKNTIKEIVEMIGAKTSSEAKEKLTFLMQDIGLKTTLNELGLQKSDLDIIIKNGFNPERVKNNPRQITSEQLKEILEHLL